MSLTVAAAVAAVAWTVLVRIRHVFEERDEQETTLFVSQFEREFQNRSAQVAAAVDRLAAGDRAHSIALQMSLSGDASPYVTEAQSLAADAQLDFLEIVGPDGNIVSSAQWPARFGYPEPAVTPGRPSAFLKREDLHNGASALGLFAVRTIRGAESAVRLVGGERVDQRFLSDLPVAPGLQVALYSDNSAGAESLLKSAVFDAKQLVGSNGDMHEAGRYQALIASALTTDQQQNAIVSIGNRGEDSVNATAIPLKNETGQVLAVLLVTISREGMVEAERHIRAIAYGVASGGILLAIAFSFWIAARVSRPIEQLAHAAEEVASGNWDAHVPEHGHDEVSVLARSFNHMTEQLAAQREQLLQSERVAAWRELARRLAHELKNPLFPLQITVENLIRARALPETEFDEVFRESTATLGMEIANLKTIIGRFSDFSKMPKPELERIEACDVVERVRSLYEGATSRDAKIEFAMKVSREPMPLMADPELLHRALSNLVLNAMDAMPQGGRLTLAAEPHGDKIQIEVQDTGEGLTPKECERLFTPYYTSKQHGTGLGLAIVQSIVADHGGTIAVESRAGGGATFMITLPKATA